MRDHKSLVAWQRANAVTRWVLRSSQKYWRPHARAIFDQIQRASLSVQLNIAEGYALRSPRSFNKHLRIAYGSVVETIELLELLEGEHIVPSAEVSLTLRQAGETQALLLGLMRRYGGREK
jgi:four helix bundle protein